MYIYYPRIYAHYLGNIYALPTRISLNRSSTIHMYNIYELYVYVCVYTCVYTRAYTCIRIYIFFFYIYMLGFPLFSNGLMMRRY